MNTCIALSRTLQAAKEKKAAALKDLKETKDKQDRMLSVSAMPSNVNEEPISAA